MQRGRLGADVREGDKETPYLAEEQDGGSVVKAWTWEWRWSLQNESGMPPRSSAQHRLWVLKPGYSPSVFFHNVPQDSVSLSLIFFPTLTAVFGEGEQGLSLLPSTVPLWLHVEIAVCLYRRVKNTSVQERSCPSGRPKEILSPHLISRKKKIK